MGALGPAYHALRGGDPERAKQALAGLASEAPGAAYDLIARISLAEGHLERAQDAARYAVENFSVEGRTTLADVVGRRGRRAEAEEMASSAINANPDSGRLRVVLGEQRIRQGKWDLGTQDIIDALSLDERPAVRVHLHRLLHELSRGCQAQKVSPDQAITFIDRVTDAAPRNDGELIDILLTARRQIQSGNVLPPLSSSRVLASLVPGDAAEPPRKRTKTVPPPVPASAREAARIKRQQPKLVAIMQRDRAMNEQLQQGLDGLGDPIWPSDRGDALDTIPTMAPSPLAIDREEFQREHLNVTSGSVATEIVIERALQSLLNAISDTTANAPSFDEFGLGQLEIALWDGAFAHMAPIPDVYVGEHRDLELRVLGLGAFMGACVIMPGSATWSFEKVPERSTIETAGPELEPFRTARAWFEDDGEDVFLEGFLRLAERVTQVPSRFVPRQDPTHGLSGHALSMKLAELWMNYRGHPLDTPQNEVAASIRPLNEVADVLFFGLGTQYAPVLQRQSARSEMAMAYLRATGEFLVLADRKHFARAIGLVAKRLTETNARTALSLFTSFHRPGWNVLAHELELAGRGRRSTLEFVAAGDGENRAFVLVHEPRNDVPWKMYEEDA